MNDERVKELLRTAIKPAGDVELRRDLWPEMRQRMDRQTMRVSVFDWALVAAVLAWAVIFPEAALALLYHL